MKPSTMTHRCFFLLKKWPEVSFFLNWHFCVFFCSNVSVFGCRKRVCFYYRFAAEDKAVFWFTYLAFFEGEHRLYGWCGGSFSYPIHPAGRLGINYVVRTENSIPWACWLTQVWLSYRTNAHQSAQRKSFAECSVCDTFTIS